MASFCLHCGNRLDESDEFCGACGSSVNYAPPQPAPYQNYYNAQPYYQVAPQTNGFAVAGFVLSFFIPLLGLIFSCIGLSKSKEMYDKGRGLAVAGIILSIVFMVLAIIIIIAASTQPTRYYYY